MRWANHWADTTLRLPERRWHNLFTGEIGNGGEYVLDKLLQRFPVALLSKKQEA